MSGERGGWGGGGYWEGNDHDYLMGTSAHYQVRGEGEGASSDGAVPMYSPHRTAPSLPLLYDPHQISMYDSLSCRVPHPLTTTTTTTLRAEEHLPNTLRQVLIYDSLKFPRPTFAHVSLILAPDKSKLSKR